MVSPVFLASLALCAVDPLADRALAAATLPETPLHKAVAEKRATAVPANSSPLLARASNATAAAPRILIMGDSWGTISPATKYFEYALKQHNCPLDGFANIAVGGTTAKQWASLSKLAEVKKHAKEADVVWITLMGNDALAECPGCASQGKTASQCGDELMVSVRANMNKILDAIHEANPAAKVVGFGYDIMFGGFGCNLIQKDIFPQCWHNKTERSPVHCFNTELIRIQELWEQLAASRPDYVTAINILGATQIAGGDTVASIGLPNMDKTGPAKYWPDTLECIHPSKGDKDSGAMVVMAAFYEQFWSKTLGC